MTVIIDRFILFLISVLMISDNQADYILVGLILAVIIVEGLVTYFDDKTSVLIISIVYIIIAIWQPMLVFFYPIIIYECVYTGLKKLLPVHVIVAIVSYGFNLSYGFMSKETLELIIFMLVGLVMGYKASKERETKEKLHNLQDEGSYLVQKNKQNREEILRKQDYEIHAATLQERNRIAREIHDHVGHMLSRSILQLGAILSINKDEKLDAPLRGLKDTLDTAMNNIRESVHDLKDESMNLRYMVNDIIGQYDLEISFDYDMSEYTVKEIKYCFMAIVKEALTNTAKHSDATKVSIVMREHPALYQMLIEDNGNIDTNVAEKIDMHGRNVGIGLENMRERVNAFDGNIRFSYDNGFKIFVSIPKKGDM